MHHQLAPPYHVLPSVPSAMDFDLAHTRPHTVLNIEHQNHSVNNNKTIPSSEGCKQKNKHVQTNIFCSGIQNVILILKLVGCLYLLKYFLLSVFIADVRYVQCNVCTVLYCTVLYIMYVLFVSFVSRSRGSNSVQCWLRDVPFLRACLLGVSQDARGCERGMPHGML